MYFVLFLYVFPPEFGFLLLFEPVIFALRSIFHSRPSSIESKVWCYINVEGLKPGTVCGLWASQSLWRALNWVSRSFSPKAWMETMCDVLVFGDSVAEACMSVRVYARGLPTFMPTMNSFASISPSPEMGVNVS